MYIYIVGIYRILYNKLVTVQLFVRNLMNSNTETKTAFWGIIIAALAFPIFAVSISALMRPLPADLTINGNKYNTSEYSGITDYGLYLAKYIISQKNYANDTRLKKYTKGDNYLEFYYQPNNEVYKYAVFKYSTEDEILIGDKLNVGKSTYDEILDYFGRSLFKVATYKSPSGMEVKANKYHVKYDLFFNGDNVLYGVIYENTNKKDR